jgi:hypothetical protein
MAELLVFGGRLLAQGLQALCYNGCAYACVRDAQGLVRPLAQPGPYGSEAHPAAARPPAPGADGAGGHAHIGMDILAKKIPERPVVFRVFVIEKKRT